MKPKKQIQQREDSAAQLFKCKEMEIPAVRLYSCPFFKTIEQNKADQKLMKVPAEWLSAIVSSMAWMMEGVKEQETAVKIPDRVKKTTPNSYLLCWLWCV